MKRNITRSLFSLLIVLCLLLAAMPALADDNTAAAGSTQPLPYSIGVAGEITSINEEQITITYQDEAGTMQELVLNITANTPCLDNQTGEAVALGTLAVGDEIYAYHSAATTFSLPPQSAALAILTNVGKSTPAHLHKIEQTDTNDGFRFLADHGSIWVRVTEESELKPYLTRMIVGTDTLMPGSFVLAWYDQVALSLPAQATATRIVYLTQPEASGEITLQINGKTIEETAKIEGGVLMMPLRAVAEELGYTVGWDAATRSINLTTAAEEQLTAKASNADFPAAPMIDTEGRAWISADYLSMLMVQSVNLTDNICSITK